MEIRSADEPRRLSALSATQGLWLRRQWSVAGIRGVWKRQINMPGLCRFPALSVPPRPTRRRLFLSLWPSYRASWTLALIFKVQEAFARLESHLADCVPPTVTGQQRCNATVSSVRRGGPADQYARYRVNCAQKAARRRAAAGTYDSVASGREGAREKYRPLSSVNWSGWIARRRNSRDVQQNCTYILWNCNCICIQLISVRVNYRYNKCKSNEE